MTRRTKQTSDFNGFAIAIGSTTDLGSAILVAESEDGCYQPVAIVGTLSEAREIAASDLRERMNLLEKSGDGGLCPARYQVWARGVNGAYRIASEINAVQ